MHIKITGIEFDTWVQIATNRYEQRFTVGIEFGDDVNTYETVLQVIRQDLSAANIVQHIKQLYQQQIKTQQTIDILNKEIQELL